MTNDPDAAQVNINKVAGHDETDHTHYPTNRVVGLLDSEATARKVVAHLQSEGVPAERIEVFFGPEGSALLHSHHGQTGLHRWLVAATRLLSMDEEHSKEYEDAVSNGEVLVQVKVPDDEWKERVRATLASEGGHRIRYFGPFVIEDL